MEGSPPVGTCRVGKYSVDTVHLCTLDSRAGACCAECWRPWNLVPQGLSSVNHGHRGDERHNGTGRGPVTTAAYLSCLRALLLSARMKNGSHAILCFVSVLLDPPRLLAVCASLE